MNFTEFQFDREQIKELVRQRASSLKANRGFSDFKAFALGVIERRLEKDPLRYRDYGPYWPALKSVLNDSGRDYGDESDPLIAQAYVGDTDEETIVMADEFRNHCLATQPVGTTQFVLDGYSGTPWILEDSDMELRAADADN